MRIIVAITVAMSGIALIIVGVAMLLNIPAAMIVAGVGLLAAGAFAFDVTPETSE